MTSMKTYGKVMIFYFSTNTIPFLSRWNELNIIYQYGSVPVFIIMAVLYSIAVLVTPDTTQEQQEQKLKK
eukprot:CAMPEP_0194177578 /NCGR_PEP_ID=MMETSP0154-20130528/11302_1 /TAXON_ID=1049557 /ORGANISM="Thalassiothrix antarctica, Strain L6-D1" /LENGTH=69 /DNA_ID=CAMNT_0038892189 /DNA_START=1 /DNA_END=207 /DNA_ORIENTATION=-